MTRPSMHFTRRSFLVGAAATAGCASLRILPASAAPKSLCAYAAEKGILFGSAISIPGLRDAAYSAVIGGQCGITVPENALKWAALRPQPDIYDFKDGDLLYEFSKSHGMPYRGHALVWHGGLPKWFGGVVNAGNARTMMEQHISTVVRHYAGKMHSWDVINEVVEIPDGRPDGLRLTPWLQTLGPDYIEMAFRAAHEADPSATLVYNENFLEPETAATESKRTAVLNLITTLKKRGVPFQALGIQSHLYAEAFTTGPNFRHFLDAIADLGLTIFITEMDVRDKNLPADIAARDRVVADQYFNYLSFVLQCKAVKAVLTWGLSDRYTWLADSQPRTDRLPVRPLPYDAELNAGPSWDAIRRAFQEARRS